MLAHSIGAVFALGAAGRGAPIRRMVLCEPPGPPTQSREALERRMGWIADGQAGRALVELLVEVMGLDPAMLAAMRDTPRAAESLAVFTATYGREGEFLQTVDVAALARDVTVPVHFLLGEQSPAWAGEVTRALLPVLPGATVTTVPSTATTWSTPPPTRRSHLGEFLA